MIERLTIAGSTTVHDEYFAFPMALYERLSSHDFAAIRKRFCGARNRENWKNIYILESWQISGNEYDNFCAKLQEKHSISESIKTVSASGNSRRLHSQQSMLTYSQIIGGDAELDDTQETIGEVIEHANAISAGQAFLESKQASLQADSVAILNIIMQFQTHFDIHDETLSTLATAESIQLKQCEQITQLQQQYNILEGKCRQHEISRIVLEGILHRLSQVEASIEANTTVISMPEDWSEYQTCVQYNLVKTMHGIGMSAIVVGSHLISLNQTSNLAKAGDLLSLVSNAVPVFGLATAITGALLKAADNYMQTKMLSNFEALERSPVDMDIIFKRVAMRLLGKGSEVTMLLDKQLLDESSVGQCFGKRLLSVCYQRVIDHSGLREFKFPEYFPMIFDKENIPRDHAGKIAAVMTTFIYRGELQKSLQQDSELTSIDVKVNILVDCVLQVFGKARTQAEQCAQAVVLELQHQVALYPGWNGWSTLDRHKGREQSFVLLLGSALMKSKWRAVFLDSWQLHAATKNDQLITASTTIVQSFRSIGTVSAAAIEDDEGEVSTAAAAAAAAVIQQSMLPITKLANVLLKQLEKSSSSSKRKAAKTILKVTSREKTVAFDERIDTFYGISWQWRETQDFLMQLEEALVEVVREVPSTIG